MKSRTWPLFNFQQAPTGALYVANCHQIRMLTPRSAFLIINPKPAPSLPVWSTPPIGCQPPLAEASPPSQTLKIFFSSVQSCLCYDIVCCYQYRLDTTYIFLMQGALRQLQYQSNFTQLKYFVMDGLDTKNLSPDQRALPTVRQCLV